jgi:hypothetical protein
MKLERKFIILTEGQHMPHGATREAQVPLRRQKTRVGKI